MTITGEILSTWRDPAEPVRRLLAGGVREDRALAILMGAAVLIFVARAPAIARAAELDMSVPLQARLGTSLFALLFLLPLIAYALAGVLHLVLRAFGARGGAHGARIALFWALLAIAPAMLLQGLAEGLVGPGLVVTLSGVAVFAAFLWFLIRGLAVAYGDAS